ncbi:hypothetical protein D3C72_2110910 [compost metagenome]
MTFFDKSFENFLFVIKFSPSDGICVILLIPLFISAFIKRMGTEILGAAIFILSDITSNNSDISGSS